jgi:hypothetical protein
MTRKPAEAREVSIVSQTETRRRRLMEKGFRYLFVDEVKRDGKWVDASRRRSSNMMDYHVATILTKDDTCGRGEYFEEIDVLVERGTRHKEAAARKVAQAAIDAEYDDSCKIAKVIWTWL